jgi:hypothetical protein
MIINKKLQTIIGMVFLTSNAFGQISEEHLDKNIKEKFGPQCYIAPLLNLVNSNLNYGSDNLSVAGYKKAIFAFMMPPTLHRASIKPQKNETTSIRYIS